MLFEDIFKYNKRAICLWKKESETSSAQNERQQKKQNNDNNANSVIMLWFAFLAALFITKQRKSGLFAEMEDIYNSNIDPVGKTLTKNASQKIDILVYFPKYL